MTDYIKREDALDALREYPVAKLKTAIRRLPSADVAPIRHGRWVVIDAEEPRRYGCSECKRLSWNMENYCGNCGARMDVRTTNRRGK